MPLAFETLNGRWSDFVGDVLKKRIALGTTLRESILLDASNGSLRILCPDDFHHATLRRHKDFLAETFAEFFGSRISFEPLMPGEAPEFPRRDAITPAVPGAPRPELSSASAPVAAGTEHPLIEVLKREFGAERVGGE